MLLNVQESGVHVLYDRWIYFIRKGWRSLVQGVEKNAEDWRGWGRGWVENVLGSTNTRPVYAWASKPPLHSSRLCRCCRRRCRRRRRDARRRQTLGFRLMDHFSFLDSTRRSPTSLRAHPYDHLPAPSKLPSSAILSSSSFPSSSLLLPLFECTVHFAILNAAASTITRSVWWRTRFLESCSYHVQEGEDPSFPWKWFIIAGNYRGSAARLRFHAIRWLKKQDGDGESGWMGLFAICYGLRFRTLSFCDISIVFPVIKPLLFSSLSRCTSFRRKGSWKWNGI